jgi:hypothetical protein
MVSLDEGTLFLKKQGRVLDEEQELRAARFYYALVRVRRLQLALAVTICAYLRVQILSDLVCEMQETDVAKRYSVDRGTVQVIQQLVSIVSHMVCFSLQSVTQ